MGSPLLELLTISKKHLKANLSDADSRKSSDRTSLGSLSIEVTGRWIGELMVNECPHAIITIRKNGECQVLDFRNIQRCVPRFVCNKDWDALFHAELVEGTERRMCSDCKQWVYPVDSVADYIRQSDARHCIALTATMASGGYEARPTLGLSRKPDD